VKLRALVALVALLIIAAIALGAAVVSADPPQPTIGQLKAKIRAQQNRIADLNDEIDTKDAVIDAQGDVITRLRARDPLDAVLARDADGLWSAMIAIWQEFPALQDGDFCGYDKGHVPPLGDGLVASSYTFYRWSGC